MLYPNVEPSAYCILSGYADSHPVRETKRLVSFSQLHGGQAYNNAFVRRAVSPIERLFGHNSGMLLKAAQRFDCERLGAGDYSVKIQALPLVPITIVLYEASSEFSASANMLFDSSVSNYLSTEQVAMLGELTAARLKHASDAFSHSIS